MSHGKKAVKAGSDTEKKLKTIGKIAKIVGYTTSLAFVGVAIYWFLLPGGWIVGVGFLIPAIIIAIETHRVIKT